VFAFDQRLRLAIAWLTARVTVLSDEMAGWGWVPDVHPNPQNTAETVDAYLVVGQEIPHLDQVVRMLESEEPLACHGQAWEFGTTVDLAHRLRALANLRQQAPAAVPVDVIDRLSHRLRGCFEATGWSLSTNDDVSVFATSLALQALGAAGDVAPDDDLSRKAWGTVAAAAADPGTHCPLASRSYAIACLANPHLKVLRTGRSERTMRAGAAELLRSLGESDASIEEETFFRGTVLDRWRHVILPLALHAIATATPHSVIEPTFREAFGRLCELQEMEGTNQGGFAAGRHGLVTSFATVQAIAAIEAVDRAIESQPDPGQLVDLVFRREGRHHTDPQVLGGTSSHPLVANSHAALAAAVLATLLAVMAAVPVAVNGEAYTANVRRIVYGTDVYLLTVVWYGYAVARLPGVSRAVIASIMFAGVTAVLFPLLSLLI
jgi:hypothetical protein